MKNGHEDDSGPFKKWTDWPRVCAGSDGPQYLASDRIEKLTGNQTTQCKWKWAWLVWWVDWIQSWYRWWWWCRRWLRKMTVLMVMMVVVMVVIVMVMVSHTHLVPKCKGQPSPETSPTPWPWWRSGMSRCTNVIMMCYIGPDLPMKLMHKYEYHAKYRQDDVPPTFMRRYTNHIAQIWMKPCWWFVTLALIDDFPTLFLVSNPDSSVLFFSTWFLKLISNEFRFGRTCRGAWQQALLLQASAFLAAAIDHRVQHSLRESAFFWWTIF